MGVAVKADEFLYRDLFPAEVLLADGVMLTRARAFVTNRRVIVWKERRNGEPYIAAELTVADFDAVLAQSASMTRDDKLEIAGMQGHAYINKGKWCGCGSALRALDPPAPWGTR